MKALAFGEILWDVYPDKKYIGGAPLNFAAHFVKCGGESAVVSAVGDDELGQETLDAVKSFGIDTSYIKKAGAQTGKCLVTLDENHIPKYNLLENTAWDMIDAEEVSGFDTLYFGTLALRSMHNRRSLEKILNSKFSQIFVDVNIRAPFYSKESVEIGFENATILKISDEELGCVKELLDINEENIQDVIFDKYKNLNCLIITMGQRGALAYARDDVKEYFSNAVKCDVKNTVGAGDSFSAAFLSRYLQGEGIQNSLDFASKIASIVVSSYDAVPDYH